jgi:ADP-ribose pyrophosphatase YjhB (NUDIX family)
MKLNITNPPKIQQHSIYFRLFAIILEKIVIVPIILFLANYKKSRPPRTRALITWNDKILLVRNLFFSNEWTLPGGGLRRSETYIQSLTREINEELAINCDSKYYKLVKHYNKKEINKPFDKICYSLDLTKTPQTKIILSPEIIEAKWISRDKMPINISILVDKILCENNKFL